MPHVRRAYLDHAASTPMRPEAVEVLAEVARTHHANPSGSHRSARAARQVIEEARDAVAELLGARPGEVVFTSGGTEADNLAVFGACARRAGVALASAVEHPAVAEPVAAVDGVTVGVDRRGVLDLDALTEALDRIEADGEAVGLVSIMAVNNEVGTIQPLGDVADLVRRRAPAAVLHTDAVQAVPWVDVAVLTSPFDLVAVSAHKFGGPKGVGVLVVREGTPLAAQVRGGGQERERRSGTPNVAGIAAAAVALAAAVAERPATIARVGALRDRLADGLAARIPGLLETGVDPGPDGRADRRHKVAGNCHICVAGVESESLLFLLEEAGVEASAASSCASGAMTPSPVLAAMGVGRSEARGALRLSLGATSTDADVDAALAAVPAAVERLRRCPLSDGAR